MNKHLLLSGLYALILALFYFSYLKRKYRKISISYPYKVESLPLNELSKYLKKRIQYVVDNSSDLDPYNKKQFNIVAQSILDNSNNLEATVLNTILLPNADLGNIPITPLLKDPIQTTNFQFGQGMTGWYFLYNTFVQGDIVANVFFYLMRLETIPDVLREKLNLNPGESTYYNIVGGVGINGKWYYSPYKICRGKYEAFTETTFNFEALDIPGWMCEMSSLTNGTFDINMSWNNITFRSNMRAIRPPFYNHPKGCTPCIEGAGSLYWSYTQMETSALIQIPDKIEGLYYDYGYHFSNGTGWIDRQWVNQYLTGRLGKIFVNIVDSINNKPRGLGRYLWYNLHVSKNLQYMATAFPKDDLKKGDIIDALFNRYSEDVEYGINGKITILEIVNIDGTIFPTIIHFNLFNGEEYVLNSRPFGNNVTIDGSNNFHWTGSALLYKDNKLIGTGFCEANQLQDFKEYTLNIFKKANISKNYVDVFKTKNLKFRQVWLDVVLLAILLLLITLILYHLYKGITIIS